MANDSWENPGKSKDPFAADKRLVDTVKSDVEALKGLNSDLRVTDHLKQLQRETFHPGTYEIETLQIPPSIADLNLASEFHQRLVEWIAQFDATLDQEHEVGVRLVSFGQSIVFHLKDMGFWNPSLIRFSGLTDQKAPVELIQHVSQISILLMKLPRPHPETPKQPFGFHAAESKSEVPLQTAGTP